MISVPTEELNELVVKLRRTSVEVTEWLQGVVPDHGDVWLGRRFALERIDRSWIRGKRYIGCPALTSRPVDLKRWTASAVIQITVVLSQHELGVVTSSGGKHPLAKFKIHERVGLSTSFLICSCAGYVTAIPVYTNPA